MKSTGETSNTTEKEQKLPVTEKNGTAPEKTEHILNRLIIGAGVCVAVIAVLIGVKLYRQDRQMDITEPFARSMVLASDPLSAEKRFQAETLSADLCVGETSVPLNDISFSSQVKAGLFDLDHKKVLFAQNMYDQVYPASITKIMTALLAMEYNQPDTQVTITEEDLALEDGSQMSGLAVGDTVTMDQLFHALLIYSANDAAMAIARQVGGSVENFVQMMNDKAAELGCVNTHFNNPHGLSEGEDATLHYTCCYDMALIAKAAYQNETFRVITSTKTYQIPPTNKHDEITYLQNHNEMIHAFKTRGQYLYEYCVGGKTGYTTAANSTLVTYAEKDDMTLICVIMNAQSPAQWTDSIALYNYYFENFSLYNVAQNETRLENGEMDMGMLNTNSSFVKIDPAGNIVLPKSAEFSEATPAVSYDNTSDDVLANIKYTFAGHDVGLSLIHI